MEEESDLDKRLPIESFPQQSFGCAQYHGCIQLHTSTQNRAQTCTHTHTLHMRTRTHTHTHTHTRAEGACAQNIGMLCVCASQSTELKKKGQSSVQPTILRNDLPQLQFKNQSAQKNITCNKCLGLLRFMGTFLFGCDDLVPLQGSILTTIVWCGWPRQCVSLSGKIV